VSRPLFNIRGLKNQLFKSENMTLAIAQDGISVRLPAKTASMLSTQCLTHNNYAAIFGALREHKNLLVNQTIRLIISNHFMRFTVLHWLDGVNARQDWLALANHAFRQQYGAAADNWQIRVSLGSHGQSVIASAMDQTLYDGLMQSARDLGFNWHAIEPLMMRLLNASMPLQAAWILVAEPQHLLLCETQNGHFQRISVASPPAGQEANFATQMIARAQLQLPSQQQPASTVVHVSGQLNGSWPKEAQNAQKHILAKQKYTHHASWLAAI
jgi:hypothetical protein